MAYMTGYKIDFIALHFVLEYSGELFYLSFTKRGGHLLNIDAAQIRFPGDMFSGQDQSYKIKARYPDLEGLRVPSEDSIRQIIEAFLTLITLSGRLLLIETSLDGSHGITERTQAGWLLANAIRTQYQRHWASSIKPFMFTCICWTPYHGEGKVVFSFTSPQPWNPT
jgi:hypothetical protein